MRASLWKVAKAMGASPRPKQITQTPFDYDPAHLKRLLVLDGRKPDDSDIANYSLDLKYEEIQVDLLRYLLPVLLSAWRRNLCENPYEHIGFSEEFWPVLHRRDAFRSILPQQGVAAIRDFIRESLLDRLDQESSLRFSGKLTGSRPHQWIRALGSYAAVFQDVESFWVEWWQVKTRGHAIALCQYISILICDEDNNPIFAPWNSHEGGGPPVVWEMAGHIYDVGWHETNVAFMQNFLTRERINEGIGRGCKRPRRLARNRNQQSVGRGRCRTKGPPGSSS